ncbi:hypothetical protein GF362_07180 [Candidatus Dojkabacteria bacterium]|nr:hypothetical protein [Candidatus Dojkabacteria bacterium]
MTMYTVYQIWINFLTFFTAVTLAPGITVQDGLVGYIVSGAIYVAVIMFLPNLIEFFKINVNFWSFLFFGVVICIGYFFVMRYILVGFLYFEDVTGSEAIMGLSFLRGLELTQTWVIVFAGFFSMLLTSITQWLMGR